MGIVQARTLEWVSIPIPGGLPDPGVKLRCLMSPALADGFFTTSATWEAQHCGRELENIYIYIKFILIGG